MCGRARADNTRAARARGNGILCACAGVGRFEVGVPGGDGSQTGGMRRGWKDRLRRGGIERDGEKRRIRGERGKAWPASETTGGTPTPCIATSEEARGRPEREDREYTAVGLVKCAPGGVRDDGRAALARRRSTRGMRPGTELLGRTRGRGRVLA